MHTLPQLYSNIIVEGNVSFINNAAQSGGVMHQQHYSIILFSANSLVLFVNNSARESGGVIHLYSKSKVIIEGMVEQYIFILLF